MRTIAVAAPAARSGKTVLICRFLEAFPGRLTAVKVSDHLPDAPPGTAIDEPPCECRAPGSPFSVIDGASAFGDPAKDTGRFAAAGARRVLWCRAARPSIREAWAHLAARHLERGEIVVAEGSRVLAADATTILVVVVNPQRPREDWKSDAPHLVERADAVVWNRYPLGRIEAPEEAAASLAALAGPALCPVFTGDLRLPLRDAFPELHAMLASAIWGVGAR